MMADYNATNKQGQGQKPLLEPEFWQGLSSRASAYGVILCDIWGVVHNGVDAHREAVLALELYRKECGGRVILITNAPRPCSAVRAQLTQMGIGDRAYDGILTSGDLTQEALMGSRDGTGAGATCYHLGPARDKGLFDGAKVRKVDVLAQAHFILCTGLENDEHETAEDYRPLLEDARARGLRLLCANPDLVVARAGTLLPCAGALAALYETMGGEVVYFGKPHSPIYARAMEMAGGGPERGAVLAIGDGILTDIKGAVGQGWDSLWVLGGIASHIGNGKGVSTFCEKQGVFPTAFTPHLRW